MVRDPRSNKSDKVTRCRVTAQRDLLGRVILLRGECGFEFYGECQEACRLGYPRSKIVHHHNAQKQAHTIHGNSMGFSSNSVSSVIGVDGVASVPSVFNIAVTIEREV